MGPESLPTPPVSKPAEFIAGGADFAELVQRRAYSLYLTRGGRKSDAMSDWLQAEREIREEVARVGDMTYLR